jgi:hypothetical protein
MVADWLRWWDEGEVMLPWAVEKVARVEEQAALEKQQADEAQEQAVLEKQRADEAQLKVERLAELLRSQGIDPGEVS